MDSLSTNTKILDGKRGQQQEQNQDKSDMKLSNTSASTSTSTASNRENRSTPSPSTTAITPSSTSTLDHHPSSSMDPYSDDNTDSLPSCSTDGQNAPAKKTTPEKNKPTSSKTTVDTNSVDNAAIADDASSAPVHSNPNPPPSSMIAVKLLVSNNMAGSIIGRSGQTISDIQEKSSARIKLSQAGDFYPGTSDRVCLVQGKIGEVKMASTLILEKLFDVQLQQVDQQQHQRGGSTSVSSHHHSSNEEQLAENEDKVNADDNDEREDIGKREKGSSPFLFTARILVSASSCGMLIGRGGANIKSMKEVSGVTSIRLSARQTDSSAHHHHHHNLTTLERVLTISDHELKSCVKCAHLILNCVGSHPDICRYANTTTSYSKIHTQTQASSTLSSAVSSPAPAGSPNLNTILINSASTPSHHHHQQQQQRVEASAQQVYGSAPGAVAASGSTGSHADTLHMDSVQKQLNITRGQSPSKCHQQKQQPFQQKEGVAENSRTQIPASQDLPAINTTGAAQVAATMHLPKMTGIPITEQQHRTPIQQLPPARTTATTHTLPSSHQQYPNSIQIAIPDTKIGAILGRRGRTLDDLQSRSGARIKISQRGVFLTGTNDRIVIVAGPTPESVDAARRMIHQCIERQNSSSGGRVHASSSTGQHQLLGHQSQEGNTTKISSATSMGTNELPPKA